LRSFVLAPAALAKLEFVHRAAAGDPG